MNKITTLYFLLLFTICSKAQNWQPLGPIDDVFVSNGQTSNISMTIDNMGVPYVAFSDGIDANKIHVRKYNGTAWEDVGMSGFSAASAQSITILIDKNNTPYVAYVDDGNGSKATVQKYDGTNWITVGTIGFTPSPALALSMVIDATGTLYVAYEDYANGNKASVKKYNGTAWIDVGAPDFSVGSANEMHIALTRSGTPYVAYRDGGVNDKAIVKKYDGASWVNVGVNSASIANIFHLSMAIDTITDLPYVVYCNNAGSFNDSVKKFDGTKWVPVAGTTSVTSGITTYNTITIARGIPYVFCAESGNPTIKKYDGTNWVNVGPTMTTPTTIQYPAIAFSNNYTPYIAYLDPNNGKKISVKKYNGTDWVSLYATGIATAAANNPALVLDTAGIPYTVFADAANGNKLSVKKYNGTNWTYVGAPAFSTAAVTYPPAIAIDKKNVPYVVYVDADNITVQKFNGTAWVIVGSSKFAVGGANFVSISIDASGTPYVAYMEQGTNYTNLAAVKKFDGTWINVGPPGISTGPVSHTTMGISRMGVPYIVFQAFNTSYQNIGIMVRKFDGANWVDVGQPSSGITETSYNAITFDTAGLPCIAFQALTQPNYTYQVKTKRYDGTSWIDVGGNLGNTFYDRPISLAVSRENIPYLSFIDDSTGKQIVVKKYEANNWQLVGTTSVSSGEGINSSLAINKDTIICMYQTGTNNGLVAGGGAFAKQYPLVLPACDTATGLIVANITTNTANISWIAKPGIIGYEYKLDQNVNAPVAGTPIVANTYTASGLQPNTVYYFHLRVNCLGNNYSIWTTREFKTAPGCDMPRTMVVTNVTSSDAEIDWTAVSGAIGYEYVLDQTASNPVGAGTFFSGITYNATGLNANTQYYFHLRTKCMFGNFSGWMTRSFTTFPGCNATAGITIANVTTSSADINWTAVTGAAGYEYLVDKISTDPTTTGAPTTAVTYTATGLTVNTQYYFHLRTDCGSGSYSAWTNKPFTTATSAIQKVTSDMFEFTIYPNPVKDWVTAHINKGSGTATLKLIDITGKTVKTLQVNVHNGDDIFMDIHNISPGAYWLKYTDGIHTKTVSLQKI